MPSPLPLASRLGWLIYLLLGTTLAARSQSVPASPALKFGQIGVGDLQTDPYPQDTTAEAVVLYEHGKLRIEMNSDGLWLVTQIHVRTKIRKKSAYDRATVSNPLRKVAGVRSEYLADLEGYTYNLVAGAVSKTKLDKSGIFSEKVSDNVVLHKFTLPNVREGAIIDYKYTKHTPFDVAYNPDTWAFQQHVPVLWSEYEALIPSYFYYKLIMSGYLPLAISETKQTTCSLLPGQATENAIQYRFAVKNAPAFRNEAYITTESDYLSKVEFDLASLAFPGQGPRNFSVGWDAMDATLLKEAAFGGQFKRAPFLRDVADLIKKQHPDSLGRIKAAFTYVAHTMKWNGTNGLTSNSTKKAFDARQGDAGDINLLLIGLLRELDFDANPVILSTRSHGRVDEAFALLTKFNYVVAQVSLNGKDLLLDATDAYLKPGMLPRHCLNGIGRLVHLTKGRFVSLLPTERDVEVVSATLSLDEEGELSGTLDQSYGGYRGLTARKALIAEGKTKYIDAIRKKRTAWQIESAALNNVDSVSKSLTISYKLTIPEACQLAGDRLYLRPMLTEGLADNQFKNPERRYPVDFGAPIDETFLATFTLPKGVVVEEAPKNMVVALPNNGGRFSFQITVQDNQVTVASRISIRKPVYYAEDYPMLREFYDKILAKHAEQIVMKRGTLADKK